MANQTRPTRQELSWMKFLNVVHYCHHCGGKLERRYVPLEKTERLVCVLCGQITYTNPKVVTGLIPVMPDGRIALLTRAIEPEVGKWTYPAGYQELGESSPDAAVRETWEEICARVKVTSLLGVYSYPKAGVVTIVYVGKVLRGEKPKAGTESLEVELFRARDIPWKKLAFRSTVDALKDWTLL